MIEIKCEKLTQKQEHLYYERHLTKIGCILLLYVQKKLSKDTVLSNIDSEVTKTLHDNEIGYISTDLCSEIVLDDIDVLDFVKSIVL